MGPLNAPDSNRLRPDSGPARSRSVSSDRSPRATDGSTPGAESDEKPRGRGGRVGPLNAVTKAKAAFMRQLGACDVCHHRRVGVSLDPLFLSFVIFLFFLVVDVSPLVLP